MRGKHRFPLFLVTTLCALPLSAANYKVQHLNDNLTLGDGCSLREAISAHNSSNLKGANECGAFDPGADTIEFSNGVTGTLRLDPALGELRLTEPELTIQGPGASQLSISGGKVMSILVLDLLRPPVLTVRDLTLRNGFSSLPGPWNSHGGGIRMDTEWNVQGPPTTIVVEDCDFLANTALLGVASHGAAISSYGSLTLRRTRFRFNQSDLGALWHSGDALIEDCEFSDNFGDYVAAGAFLISPGLSTVRRTLFKNNTIHWNGPAAILFYSAAGKALVENCTFVGNSSTSGEVVYSGVPITLLNSTFYGNAQVGGGGGTAVVTASMSYLVARSNLFAQNDRPAVVAPDVTAGYNLFDTAAADLPAGVVCATTTLGGANLCGVSSPGLGPLSDNGGPTWTMPLLTGSPALDAGTSSSTLLTDQRGPGYARIVGPGTDIGAFEVQP